MNWDSPGQIGMNLIPLLLNIHLELIHSSPIGEIKILSFESDISYYSLKKETVNS